MEKSAKMVIALLIISILAIIISYATLPYIDYIFGAFILFIIFNSLYKSFVEEIKLQKQIAAVLVIIISIFVILIPFYFLLSLVISEFQQLMLDQHSIIVSIHSGGQFLSQYLSILNISAETFQTKLQESATGFVSQAVNFTSILILGSIQNLSKQFVGLLIMYFLLFYLFTESDSNFVHKVYLAIPFNEENTAILLEEFRRIVRTTLIASGAVALAQGSILTITFLIFKIEGAFFWGAIAAILSLLPVVGAPIVWVPALIIEFLQGNNTAAFALLIAGLFISFVDHLLRPIVQQRVGEIHPLLSLIGIVIGISLFGLIGIVIGPLLLSYFFLIVEMFSKEYLSKKE